ncbi:MAG: tetratricopeptide repeat protein [Anaerolineae bacterium]|nr:tetratricopeptide repeat protein [Gemmatimonadaceae bacterium]
MSGTDLRSRFADLSSRLDKAPVTPGDDRDTIRTDIIALFKCVDAEISQLSELKEELKRLAERWKQTQGPAAGPPSLAPRFTGVQPVIRSDHLNASSFVEKGWSLIALGDHDGAERALHKGLELAPDDPQAESLLGWALMLQEKYDDALLSFQRVLMRQPGNALARVNVGYICLKKGIFGEAIEHLSKVMRIDNDRKATLYAHFYLGLVYLEREMYEDAQAFFRKSIELGPNLLEAHYELGRSLWFAGSRDDAKEAWRKGALANKFNPWGKRCAEMLKHTEGGGVLPRAH